MIFSVGYYLLTILGYFGQRESFFDYQGYESFFSCCPWCLVFVLLRRLPSCGV